MRVLAATTDHVRMEWVRKHMLWVALAGTLVGIGAVVWVAAAPHTLSNRELADVLGDQDDFVSSVSVTCVDASGKVPGGAAGATSSAGAETAGNTPSRSRARKTRPRSSSSSAAPPS